MATKFNKISEWIQSGNMKSGFYALEKVARETEKAIGFAAEKYNEYGRPKAAICWMPRSKVQVVENDFYVNGPSTMFLVPAWLYSTKTDEGFVI